MFFNPSPAPTPSIVHTTNSFLQSLTTKKNTWENIKADMAVEGLKGKEYIHSIGRWNEYMNYLEKNILHKEN